MAINNPVLRAGTEGAKEFLEVATASLGGTQHWVGIRPIMNCGLLPNGGFHISIMLRMRFDSDGKGHCNTTTKNVLSHNLPGVASPLKIKDDYASYTMSASAGGHMDSNAYKAVQKIKDELGVLVTKAYDHIQGIGAQMQHSKPDVILYMMSRLEEICSKHSIDIGDPNDKDVPKDQPFVTKYNAKKSGTSGPAVTKPADPVAKAPEEKAPQEPEEQDLSNLSFDELMANISKKKDS